VCGTKENDLALVGNLARLERRLWLVEVEVALIILSLFGSLILLYQRGVGLYCSS
jgi:hypothetical protein